MASQGMNPQVSVIVPSYNARAFLSRCIASILGQLGPKLELIVVNDGSTDGTEALLAQIADDDPRVLAVHQANAGLSAARNTGIKHARGEWVLFCDADDMLLPGALKSMCALATDETCSVWGGFVRRHSEVDDSTGDSDRTGRGKREARRIVGSAGEDHISRSSETSSTHYVDSIEVARRIVRLRGPVVECGGDSLTLDGTLVRSACAKLYRRTALLGENGVRFRPDAFLGEDALFNIDYLTRNRGKVAITMQTVYFYDVTGSVLTKRFSNGDVHAMSAFCRHALDAISPLIGKGADALAERDARGFAGREMQAVVNKAARYGPGIREAASMLEPALTDPLVRECWSGAHMESAAAQAGARTIARLATSGHPAAALAFDRVALRLKDHFARRTTRA